MTQQKNIVILISGRGSNMQALLEACAHERWNARIAAVISNRPDAVGLAFARERGVPTQVVDHKAFAGRSEFEARLREVIDAEQPHIVALAGFMRVLGAEFVQHYAGRLVNIHPSLLPAFPGLDTHQRAIEAGCKVAGATVHWVTAEVDHGPILAQAVVPVLPDDTPEVLAERVLRKEHLLYPMAVRWMVDEQLRLDQGVLRHVHGATQCLL